MLKIHLYFKIYSNKKTLFEIVIFHNITFCTVFLVDISFKNPKKSQTFEQKIIYNAIYTEFHNMPLGFRMC